MIGYEIRERSSKTPDVPNPPQRSGERTPCSSKKRRILRYIPELFHSVRRALNGELLSFSTLTVLSASKRQRANPPETPAVDDGPALDNVSLITSGHLLTSASPSSCCLISTSGSRILSDSLAVISAAFNALVTEAFART